MAKTCLLIPAYNAEFYLGACLNSTTDFDKVIVWNDGSTDRTLDIAEQFSHIEIYSAPRQGVQAVRNLLFQVSIGCDYVAYLDADDARIPNVLEKQLRHFQNSSLSGIFSPVISSPSGKLVPTEADPVKSALKRLVQTGSMLFRRSALQALKEQQGYVWDESVSCMHENHLIADLIRHNAWLGFCEDIPSIYRRQHSTNQFTAQTTLVQLVKSYQLLMSKLKDFLGVHWKEYEQIADQMESVFLFNLKREQKRFQQHVSSSNSLGESNVEP